MLCHHTEVAKDFGVATTDYVFCNVIGAEEKPINVNEAQGISQTSPDPLFLGGVWAQDSLVRAPGTRLGTRLPSQ